MNYFIRNCKSRCSNISLTFISWNTFIASPYAHLVSLKRWCKCLLSPFAISSRFAHLIVQVQLLSEFPGLAVIRPLPRSSQWWILSFCLLFVWLPSMLSRSLQEKQRKGSPAAFQEQRRAETSVAMVTEISKVLESSRTWNGQSLNPGSLKDLVPRWRNWIWI